MVLLAGLKLSDSQIDRLAQAAFLLPNLRILDLAGCPASKPILLSNYRRAFEGVTLCTRRASSTSSPGSHSMTSFFTLDGTVCAFKLRLDSNLSNLCSLQA